MEGVQADFKEVQTAIRESFFKESNKMEVPPAPPLVDEIKKLGVDALKTLLGENGAKLADFIGRVDFDHPESAVSLPTARCSLLSEIIKISCYAATEKYSQAMAVLRNYASREIKEYFPNIDDPERNNKFVRLVNSPEIRNQIRAAKGSKRIGLESFTRNANWDNFPSSLLIYVRNGNGKEIEIQKAMKKMERFQMLGCALLANEIGKSVDAFRSKSDEDFLGFRRLNMTDATVCLAKIHNCSCLPSMDGTRIRVSKSRFPYTNQNGSGTTLSAYYEKYVVPKEFDFIARAYPYSQLADHASEETKKIVNYVEALPELNFKPAFDYITVIVPTTAIMSSADWCTQNHFVDEFGENHTFHNLEETQTSLDIHLIRRQHVMPIILGEREGKCYFISYFEC